MPVARALPRLPKGALRSRFARIGGFSVADREPVAAGSVRESSGRAAPATRERWAMKLVIDRGELLRGLGHVTSVVEKRTTIPILSNVLLRATEQGLQFKATDLEREVLEQTSADVSQPGATTVL